MPAPPAPITPPSRTLDRDNPWPGPEAFGEGDQGFFFGRERAQNHLSRLIVQNRLVVLYGRSGLGKTSLLRAGVFPLLREALCLPVYIRLNFAASGAPDVPALRAQVSQAIESVAEKWQVEAPPLDRGVTLWEWFFRSDVQFFNERSRRVRPVLVLDQFEEAFTHGRATEAQAGVTEDFLDEVIDLVRGSVPASVVARLEKDASGALAFNTGRDPCGVLIALRQEFLAELLRLRPRLPSVLDHRFELTAMTIEDATLVVTGPGQHLIADGVAGEIVRFVATARRGSEDPAPEATMVDPAILSIFCSELNATRQKKGMPVITTQLVEGAQDTIIADFYDHRVEDLDPEVQRFIESRLVTESGYRNSEAVTEALRWPTMTVEVIDQLVERRLLVREGSGPRARLELTHDVLLDPIIHNRTLRQLRDREEQARVAEEKADQDRKDAEERSRRERELETARVLLEREREMTRLTTDLALQKESEAQAERKALKRQRRLAVALAVALAAAIGLAGLSYLAGQKARTATSRATVNLSSTHLEQGLAATAGGDPHRGLAFFARALRTDPGNAAARSLALDAIIHWNWPLPSAQLRHDGRVSSIQFDTSGTRIVTASDDRTARVWSVVDWTPVGRPLQHGRPVLNAQFLASGKEIVTRAERVCPPEAPCRGSGDPHVRVWDVASGGETRRLSHPGPVSAVAVSPVDDRVVTGSEDGTVRIWTGGASRTIRAHPAPVVKAAFDPAGRHLVTASATGASRVWDAATGARLAALKDHADEIVWIQFSPDGKLLATASRDSWLRVYSTANYKIVGEVEHKQAIETAAFGPAGQTIVTASGNDATLWDAPTLRPIGDSMTHASSVVSVAFSPEGLRVLTASRDGTARIWNELGTAVSEPMRIEAPEIALFRPDGQQAVVSAHDGSITAWDVRTGSAISSEWPAGCNDPAVIGFTADAQQVVGSCPGEGAVVFWDHDTKTVRRLTNPAWAGMSSVQFSDDRSLLVVVVHSMAFVVRDTGEVIRSLEHAAPVSSALFSPDGQLVLTVVPNGRVKIWNIRSGGAIEVGEPGGSLAARFSADGSRAVTTDVNGVPRVWTTRGSEPVGPPLQLDQPDRAASRSVGLTRDGRSVLSHAGDEPVTISGAADGKVLRKIPPDRHVGFAEFDRSNLVLTAGAFQQSFADPGPPVPASIWDAQTGQVLATLGDSPAALQAALFSDGGQRVALFDTNGRLSFWDARTGQPHTRPWALRLGYGASLTLAPDGQRAAIVTDERRVVIRDAPSGEPEDAALIAEILDAMVGYSVSERGAIEQPKQDRVEALRTLRGKCHSGAPLARRVCEWMVADRASRTINPFTSVTVEQFVQERLKSPADSDRVEALALLPWDARLRSGGRGVIEPGGR